MNNLGESTGGIKEGFSQLAVCSDIFNLLHNIHKSADHRRDPPVTQNPAEGWWEIRTANVEIKDWKRGKR